MRVVIADDHVPDDTIPDETIADAIAQKYGTALPELVVKVTFIQR